MHFSEVPTHRAPYCIYCSYRLCPGLMLPSAVQEDELLIPPADNQSWLLTVCKYGSSGHYRCTQTANGTHVSTTNKEHNKWVCMHQVDAALPFLSPPVIRCLGQSHHGSVGRRHLCCHGDSQSGFDDFMRLHISVHIYSCRLEAGMVLEDCWKKKGKTLHITQLTS